MVLAKADGRIAAEYDRRLVPPPLQPLGADLRDRLARAIAAVRAVSGHARTARSEPGDPPLDRCAKSLRRSVEPGAGGTAPADARRTLTPGCTRRSWSRSTASPPACEIRARNGGLLPGLGLSIFQAGRHNRLAAEPVAPTTPEGRLIKCPNCGAGMSQSAGQCPSCKVPRSAPTLTSTLTPVPGNDAETVYVPVSPSEAFDPDSTYFVAPPSGHVARERRRPRRATATEDAHRVRSPERPRRQHGPPAAGRRQDHVGGRRRGGSHRARRSAGRRDRWRRAADGGDEGGRRPAERRPAVRRPLHRRTPAGHRRHGRGVPGVGLRACGDGGGEGRPPRGDQGPGGRARHRTPVQAGAAAGPPGDASQRRAHPRHGRDRRHQVHHDAVHRRRRPRHGAAEVRPPAAGLGDGHRASGGLRPQGRARRRRRPSRPQAGQRDDREGCRGHHHGLRHRPHGVVGPEGGARPPPRRRAAADRFRRWSRTS